MIFRMTRIPIIPPTGQYLSGIIFNQNFEDDINLTKNSDVPEDGKWYYVGGWRESGAKVSQIDGYGYKDSRCLCIAALDHTVDVAVVQRIKVFRGRITRCPSRSRQAESAEPIRSQEPVYP